MYPERGTCNLKPATQGDECTLNDYNVKPGSTDWRSGALLSSAVARSTTAHNVEQDNVLPLGIVFDKKHTVLLGSNSKKH